MTTALADRPTAGPTGSDWAVETHGLTKSVGGDDAVNDVTGRQDPEILAAAREPAARERISGALDRVGMDQRSDDKVSKYSMGMRQRLGVAACLLQGGISVYRIQLVQASFQSWFLQVTSRLGEGQ